MRIPNWFMPVLLVMAIAAPARAQEVTVTLTAATVAGAQGTRVTFRATVVNGTGNPVCLNALSPTMQGTELLYPDPTEFYANFYGPLEPGASIVDKPICSVDIDPTAAAGDYVCTMAVLGGSDDQAYDNLAQADGVVQVSAGAGNAPDTSIVQGPSDGGKACATTVTFCWTGTDDTTPTANLLYSYQMDTSGWSDWTSETCHTFDGLVEGLHTFQVKVKDADGNEDASPATSSFTVNLQPTTISDIVVTPKDVKATITWTTSDPATSQVEYGTTDQYGSSTIADSTMVTSHSVVVTGLTAQTTYHFRVKSNNGCAAVVSDDQTFTTREPLYPNLVATTLTVPDTTVQGTEISVSWHVDNIGEGDAQQPWSDTVYFSTTGTLDGSEMALATAGAGFALASGRGYDLTADIRLPIMPAGSYFLIVKADSGDAVQEADETDNARVVAITYPKVSYLIAAPGSVALTIDVGGSASGLIDLTNLGVTQLTGLAAAVEGAPGSVAVHVAPPPTIAAGATSQASFSVSAADDSALAASPTIRFTTAEGEEATVSLSITVVPHRPQLVLSPESFDAGMVRGQQATAEVVIRNTGSVAATNLKVSVPYTPWMSLVTPDTIASLEPGGKAKIGLQLRPALDLALGPYTGSVSVVGDNAKVTIPYRFVCASEGKGDLALTATDEYTYFAVDKPNVANATVKLLDAASQQVIVEGVTDASGHFSPRGIPEATYNVEVSAEKHGTFRGVVTIVAGVETALEAFVPQQFVTYSWSVVPIDIGDEYKIDLVATFETHVPAPVVTVNPTFVNLKKLKFDANGKAIVMYTVTNHGLIAVNKTRIELGSNSTYTCTPFIDDLGVLPALTTVIVPVTITKGGAPQQAHSSMRPMGAGGGDECWLPVSVPYCYPCGGERWGSAGGWLWTGIFCGSPGGPGLPGDWGAGGGGGGFHVSQPAPCCIVDQVVPDALAVLVGCPVSFGAVATSPVDWSGDIGTRPKASDYYLTTTYDTPGPKTVTARCRAGSDSKSASVVAGKLVKVVMMVDGDATPVTTARITSVPAMPRLRFVAKLDPEGFDVSDLTFKWSLDIRFTQHGRTDHHRVPVSGTVDHVGDAEWVPEWGDLLAGGDVTVHLVISSSGCEAKSDTTGLDIRGTEPGRDAIEAEMAAKAMSDFPFPNLVCAESSWRQFTSSGWPKWGAPDGWGLMQTDPPPSEAVLWDWRAALQAGRARWDEKVQIVSDNLASLRALHPNLPDLPAYNHGGLMIDGFTVQCIKRYNGGLYYEYQAATNSWAVVGTADYIEQVLNCH